MSEIYKDLPGYEGIYKVSNYGNIVSVDRMIRGRFVRGRMLKPSDKKKTSKVNLCTGTQGIHKTYTVGYLVLTTFVGPPPTEKARARSRDGDHKNNRLENLYWGEQMRKKNRKAA